MRPITRARWKEVGFAFLTFLAIAIALAVFQAQLVKRVPAAEGQLGVTVAVLLIYLSGAKLLERRPLTEFAASRAIPEVVGGIILGVALFSSVMLVLWIAGVYHPAGWGGAQHLATGLVVSIMSGIVEELMFRGLLFRAISKLLGTWGALLCTAALFGAAHAPNPGATLASSLAIALEAGVLLGVAYAATGRLWLPIAMHFAWNFTESSVFGMTLSGNAMAEGLIRGSLSGPKILTGGEFGPEASIVAVVLCLLVAAWFIARIIRHHRAEPPLWSAARAQSAQAFTSVIPSGTEL